MSETTFARPRLSKYCIGNGLDIGFGGDPILPSSITIDLPSPYLNHGNHPRNLSGDGRDLYWFKDNTLDYVYSSHLLEDFIETEDVLREWIRVLRVGGNLIIYCPDEQVYRDYCASHGGGINSNHKHHDFSLDFIKKIILEKFSFMVIEYEMPHIDAYSWEIVARKT